MPGSLDDVYRAYLDALNERRLDALDRFVHAELTYNGTPWTRAEYAARLWFDCTPSGTFLGVEVDGGRAAFAEHVFYRFEDARIREVWSLIDTDAVRAQVGRG